MQILKRDKICQFRNLTHSLLLDTEKVARMSFHKSLSSQGRNCKIGHKVLSEQLLYGCGMKFSVFTSGDTVQSRNTFYGYSGSY